MSPLLRGILKAALCLTLAACGDPDRVGDPNGNGELPPNGSNGNGEPPDETDCFDAPANPDRPRRIVLSHPYADDASPATRYAVYLLDTDGSITPTGDTFEMARATEGRIHFTPDGSLGIVVQSRGTLGIFRFDDTGRPEVIEAEYQDGFWAGSVAIDAAARQVHLLDSNWEENGGAFIVLDLDCDGTLTEVSRVPTRLSRDMTFLASRPGKAVLAATAFDGPPDLADVHLLDLDGEAPVALSSALAFDDGNAIVSAIAATADDAYVLVGDNSAFSGVPNRISVVAVDGDGLSFVQMLSPIEDPAAIVPSPFGDALLVTSGFGDALHVITYDPDDAASPFTLAGEVAYAGPRPGIPVDAVGITEGALTGDVLVAEYLGIRRLTFQGDGTVVDHGLGWEGAGTVEMVGAIGVQP